MIYGKYLLAGMVLALLFLFGPVQAMNRPATAFRLYQQKCPCPATNKKVGPCPGWVLQYKKPLNQGGDIAPYNLYWQRKSMQSIAK